MFYRYSNIANSNPIHPYNGLVIDPFDYLPFIGATVKVNNVPRGNTKRKKDFLTKNAEQRYRELLEKRPDIISSILVHKIAKYLGIHPESLSRIRKSIIS